MLKRLLAVLFLFWLLERQALSSGTVFLRPALPAVRTAGDTMEFLRTGVLGTERDAPGETAFPFAATVRDGLLRLDFAAPIRVKTIRICDLNGLQLFAYRPGKSFDTLGWVWDGRDERGRLLPRGRYLVRVEAETGETSRSVDWNPAA